MAEEEKVETKVVDPKEEKPKKEKSKARKIIEWVLTGLFIAVFGFASFMLIYSNATKSKNHGVPKFGDMQVLVILTDSMEPTYKVNGAVFVKKVDPSEIKIGDDVTFMYTVNDAYIPMTHRVFEISTPEESEKHIYEFRAHGINTMSKQCGNGEPADCTYQYQEFDENALLGKVVGYSMFVGVTFNFMTSWYGLLTLLLIPAVYLIVTSGIDVVKALKTEEKEAAEASEAEASAEPQKEGLDALSDEDRKRLKEELLAEMIEKRKAGK